MYTSRNTIITVYNLCPWTQICTLGSFTYCEKKLWLIKFKVNQQQLTVNYYIFRVNAVVWYDITLLIKAIYIKGAIALRLYITVELQRNMQSPCVYNDKIFYHLHGSGQLHIINITIHGTCVNMFKVCDYQVVRMPLPYRLGFNENLHNQTWWVKAFPRYDEFTCRLYVKKGA